MGSTASYTQCRMERANADGSKSIHTAFIPTTFAKIEREYYKSHPKRQQAVIARANQTKQTKKQQGRELVKAFKNRPCMDCGVSYPFYVMDLDHRDKTKKEFTISMWGLGTLSLESLQAELDKCDAVCSNCHRERTHGPSRL